MRAGVAGAGVFGSYHAQKYVGLDGVSLTSVYDCDHKQAKALADKFNATAYIDYQEFLASVEVISIAAPAAVHYELAKPALMSGIHCLIEKPVSTTEFEAQVLIKAAAMSGAVLQVGHQERFVAETACLFDNLRAIRRASFRRQCPPSGRCEEVSATLDLMIHDLDLARQLGFGEPARVEASGDHHEATAVFWFEDGRRLDFTASRRAAEQDRAMTIFTDRETVEFDFVSKSGSDGRRADIADPLAYGVAKFIGAVRGQNVVVISGEDGRDALKWAMLVEGARLNKSESNSAEQEAVA